MGSILIVFLIRNSSPFEPFRPLNSETELETCYEWTPRHLTVIHDHDRGNSVTCFRGPRQHRWRERLAISALPRETETLSVLANPDITVAEVAERVGVSPATLYRYLPAARTAHGSVS